MNSVPNKRRKQVQEKAVQHGLTDRELNFCDLYTNNNELRGNGVRAYGEAFGLNLAKPQDYNTAKVNASKLLTKIEVLQYIRSIFESNDLSEEAIMNELCFVIKQNTDFSAKVQACKLVFQVNGKLREAAQPTAVQFKINLQGSHRTD